MFSEYLPTKYAYAKHYQKRTYQYYHNKLPPCYI
jgi:hypothetical protein